VALDFEADWLPGRIWEGVGFCFWWTDGFDLDEDGIPDEYSGSWEYFVQIMIGE